MKFIKLTLPNDKVAWLVPAWIVKVSAAPPGLYGGANAVVGLSGGELAVKEYPEDIVKALEAIT